MSRNIRYGVWLDFRNPEPWTVPSERFYRQSLDQIADAEGLGFGSVWLTEHHFCDDGYTPSPMVIAGAIGERTQSMRIATNLMILPLHNPIRVAEDAATLSLLTGGRFDLGVGIGYRQLEFEQFGRELRFRPSLMEEAVEIMRRAWRGEAVSFKGKRFTVGDVKITPVPEQVPRILMGGMTEAAIDRAARIADGFLSTGGIGHDLYVEALARHGRRDGGAIFAGHWAIIAEDPEREAARLGEHILYQTNQYIEWGAFGPPDQTPRFETAESAIENGLYELWDAEMAVKNLSALIEAYPQIEDIHFWGHFPGEPIESGHRRLEYIASEVLPRLRNA